MPDYDPADFEILYPGVLTERESAAVGRYLEENAALVRRGPIDAVALAEGSLPKDTPGVEAVLPVTEAMVRYNNAKYDPENRLLSDAAYARERGYQDILAMPCFGAHDDTFMVPYPPEARDTLLVSQLNHSVTTYRPIYPGDTLYLVSNRRELTDRTPAEGSIHRHLTIESEGSVYNQRGEKVNDAVFRVCESIRIFKEGKRPDKMGFAELWEAPDWMSRPEHYYSDEDWDVIKEMWAKERRRGSELLYWEDVRVGDEPAWTVDGPILESLAPSSPYGMGIGGSRTLKKDIMDPAIFRTMVRSEKNGLYTLPDRDGYIPPAPDGAVPFFIEPPENAAGGTGGEGAVDTSDIHRATEARGVLINFLGRDIAIRHVNDWMGDHGRLHSIRWGMMPPEAMANLGKTVPANPRAELFLEHVPAMKGKKALAHGLTGDLALVKSYVYDKYVRDGSFFVDLAWWIETIVGDIWLAGAATVRLPSQSVSR